MAENLAICIGNYAAYNSGYLIDEWIQLPVSDEKLQEFVQHIREKGQQVSGELAEECYISDFDIPEKYSSFCNYITEYSSFDAVNLFAKKLESLSDGELDALALCSAKDNYSLYELLNLMVQTEDIPYFPYSDEFTYTGDDIMMQAHFDSVSPEYKAGYTLIQDKYPDVMKYMDEVDIGGWYLDQYFDFAAYGRDNSMSGYIDLGEHGFIDAQMHFPATNLYSYEELKEIINNNFDPYTLGKPISIHEKYAEIELSDPAEAMCESVEWNLNNDSIPRFIDDTIWQNARDDVSVYTGNCIDFFNKHRDYADRAENEMLAMSKSEYFEQYPDYDMDNYYAYVGGIAWELWAYDCIIDEQEEIIAKAAWGFVEKEGLDFIDQDTYESLDKVITTWDKFDELHYLRDDLASIIEEYKEEHGFADDQSHEINSSDIQKTETIKQK